MASRQISCQVSVSVHTAQRSQGKDSWIRGGDVGLGTGPPPPVPSREYSSSHPFPSSSASYSLSEVESCNREFSCRALCVGSLLQVLIRVHMEREGCGDRSPPCLQTLDVNSSSVLGVIPKFIQGLKSPDTG